LFSSGVFWFWNHRYLLPISLPRAIVVHPQPPAYQEPRHRRGAGLGSSIEAGVTNNGRIVLTPDTPRAPPPPPRPPLHLPADLSCLLLSGVHVSLWYVFMLILVSLFGSAFPPPSPAPELAQPPLLPRFLAHHFCPGLGPCSPYRIVNCRTGVSRQLLLGRVGRLGPPPRPDPPTDGASGTIMCFYEDGGYSLCGGLSAVFEFLAHGCGLSDFFCTFCLAPRPTPPETLQAHQDLWQRNP